MREDFSLTWNVYQLPNGPEDGGLAVMTGTAPLFEQYFKEHQAVSFSSPVHFGRKTLTNPAGGWMDQAGLV